MDPVFKRGEPCPCCGETYFYDLLELWPDERAWQFDTCCEGAEEFLQECIDFGCSLPQRERTEYFRPIRELFADYGLPARQVYASAQEPGAARIDYGLEVREITWAEARDFVARHHRHNRKPAGWLWGHAAYNGEQLVAVAIVGRPVARMIATRDRAACEVIRLCVDPQLDSELVWNACSLLYTAAYREAERRGFTRTLTYTREDEQGGSLRAAGWVPVAKTRAESWTRAARPRPNSDKPIRKIRWERCTKRRSSVHTHH